MHYSHQLQFCARGDYSCILVHTLIVQVSLPISCFADPLSVPHLTLDRVTSSAVEYQVQRNDSITGPLLTGYEVIRFGVPMIGEYVNTGRGRRVTISPAVPGAQYRITAWALGNGTRSPTPAVVTAITGEASECGEALTVAHKKYSIAVNKELLYIVSILNPTSTIINMALLTQQTPPLQEISPLQECSKVVLN